MSLPLVAPVQALVDALPRCWLCPSPATLCYPPHDDETCDACTTGYRGGEEERELPWAPALRALLGLPTPVPAPDPTPPVGGGGNRWEAFAVDYAAWLLHVAPPEGQDRPSAGWLIAAAPGVESLPALRSMLRRVAGVEVEAVVPAVERVREARRAALVGAVIRGRAEQQQGPIEKDPPQ